METINTMTMNPPAPLAPEVLIAKRSKAAMVIWMVLTACCFLIGVLPYFAVLAPPTQAPMEPSALQMMLLTFNGFAIFMALSAIFIRLYLLIPRRIAIYAARAIKTRGLGNKPELALNQFVQTWMTFSVMVWAINESIASLGLGEALATRDPSRALPFAFVAVILNLATRPDLKTVATEAGYLPA